MRRAIAHALQHSAVTGAATCADLSQSVHAARVSDSHLLRARAPSEVRPMRDIEGNVEQQPSANTGALSAVDLCRILDQFAETLRIGIPGLHLGTIRVERGGLVIRLSRLDADGMRREATSRIAWDDLLSARAGAPFVLQIELERLLHAVGLR